MNNEHIATVIHLLRRELEKGKYPIVTDLAERERNPFHILIATLLSLRTKDEVTEVATEKLLKLAATPEKMLQLTEDEIISAIYPVGFYRNKAETIIRVSGKLVEKYESRVPDTIDELLKLKGVGRKTANLVVTLGFNKEGICVDTHVHRISNRLGYVKTTKAEETEFALRRVLPKKYWIDFNTLMVAFGRKTCRPLSPLCSKCPVSDYCDKAGVTRSR
ncbi:MAG: endonuclease III [Thermodesulfobacteriota bacterium]|nr:endonuclease III [Thermodesulfobacteriota bacterium]